MNAADIDAVRIEQAFGQVLDAIDQFEKKLSPRELKILQIGLRASHVEEALAHNEFDRAREHFHVMMKLVQQI